MKFGQQLNTTPESQTSSDLEQWVKFHVAKDIEKSAQIYLAAPIALFGILSNMICIAVFCKLGFKDLVNVKLTCLALADMMLSCVALGSVFCKILLALDHEGMLFTHNLAEFLFGMPVTCLIQLSSLITVFITLERCLCIAMPLAVKHILTLKVNVTVLVVIFSFFLTVLASMKSTYTIVAKQYRNRSVLDTNLLQNYKVVRGTIQVALSTTLLSSYAAMLVLTTFLIAGLRRQAKKRQAMMNTSEKGDTTRDRRVIKMVTLVAVFFIIFTLPQVVTFILRKSVPEVSLFRSQRNAFIVLTSVSRMSSFINSSINIFIYLWASTSFRQMCRKTLCFR